MSSTETCLDSSSVADRKVGDINNRIKHNFKDFRGSFFSFFLLTFFKREEEMMGVRSTGRVKEVAIMLV